MTDPMTAIREVLRVRDAEREDRASTEDLLDAIAGLDDVKKPLVYGGVESLMGDLLEMDPAVRAKLPEQTRQGILWATYYAICDQAGNGDRYELVGQLDDLARDCVRVEENDVSREVMGGKLHDIIGWTEPEDFTDLRWSLNAEGYECPPWEHDQPTYHLGLTASNLPDAMEHLLRMSEYGFTFEVKSVKDVEGAFEVQVHQPVKDEAPEADHSYDDEREKANRDPEADAQ